MQQLFCLSPEIVKNIDTIDTNLSNLHALLIRKLEEVVNKDADKEAQVPASVFIIADC